MSYQHIKNLYADARILQFKWVYAMEKIDGTSAHISWKNNEVKFFSGGAKHDSFVKLFDIEVLRSNFEGVFGETTVTIFGEAYGGKIQGMSKTYGNELKFVAFEVHIVNDTWLDVPNAEAVVKRFGLEFVHYETITTDLESVDAARNAFSVQAARNGIGEDKRQEGIVLRPPFEVLLVHNERLVAKHKNEEFRETAAPRVVGDKAVVLAAAEQIANEWVTAERMKHVLSKLPEAQGMEHTGIVIATMLEDVLREAEGEIVDSKEARKAISSHAAKMWKQWVARDSREK